MRYQVTADYTGRYPNLCRGEWVISITHDLSEKEVVLTFQGHLNIQGAYDKWSFDENWSEVWHEYVDGLPFHKWVKNLPNNLKSALIENKLPIDDHQLLRQIYEACRMLDFRELSCGGCI